MSKYIKVKLSEARAFYESQEQIDELSKNRVNRYVDDLDLKASDSQYKSPKRKTGMRLAADKLSGKAKVAATEEVENLDEISKKTLGSYINKASDDSVAKTSRMAELGRRIENDKSGDSWSRNHGERADLAADRYNRKKGIKTAVKKLTGQAKVNATEEVEPLQELEKKTLKSYQKKALTSLDRANRKADSEEDKAMATDGTKNPEKQKKHMDAASAHIDTANKRQSGLKMVDKKLGKASKDTRPIWAKEDVDFDDADDMTEVQKTEVAASGTGEVLKTKSEPSTGATKPTGTSTKITAGKTGEAYNTTSLTKRMPAVESAIMDIMKQNVDLRRIHLEASHITIVSPEQRTDWMQVEQGKMPVIDYFNKYRVSE